MGIDLVFFATAAPGGGDLKARNKPDEEEVEKAAGERDAGAAAVAKAVCEERGVGALEPAFGLEGVCVIGPEGWI